MAEADTLTEFGNRGRGEAARMMYSLAGKPLNTVRMTREEWPKHKSEMPTGKLPVLQTDDGRINESKAIVRYVGKKLGFSGKNMWEETLHDVVMENAFEAATGPGAIFMWKVGYGREPEKNKGIDACVAEWELVLNYIESIAEKQKANFIIGDNIGTCECFLYSVLEFCGTVVPDMKSLTPWTKEFVRKFESDEKMKKYLAERPPSDMPNFVKEKK